MKRKCVILTVGLFILMFFAFSFTNYAEEGEVSIVFSEGEYVAYSGTEMVSSSKSLDVLIGGISSDRIVFDSLTIAEPVAIRRSVTISGSFSSSSDLTIEKGAVVNFDFANIILTADASIRVKGGKLTLNRTNISANSTALRVEGVDTSELCINSGQCISFSSCALEITRGTANLFGGTIKSRDKTAVINKGTLNICGSTSLEAQAYRVKTSCPLYSIDGTLPKNLTIMMDSTFADGEMHLCIIDAAYFRGDVRIFDANGKEENVKFFESYRNLSEKNFVSVYKPYKIDLVVDGARESIYALKGEIIEPCSLPDKAGYSPKGWYIDSALEERYDFSKSITGSFSLYAGYSLLPPTFVLEDAYKVYDGTPLKLSFKSLTHPLLDIAIISYTWYNDLDEPVAEGDSLTLENVSDSGEYYCSITFSHGRDTAKIKTPKVSVTIAKGTVEVPIITPLTYNGTLQYPNVPYSKLYTANTNGYIDAGEYSFTLLLNDFENYKWECSNEKTLTVSYEIVRDTNTWLVDFSINDIYFGAELVCNAISKYGQVKYIYSLSPDGTYSLIPPSEVGRYYAKAVVEASKNYLELESSPILFEILPELPISISVADAPYLTSYYAFDTFKSQGMTLCVLYNSGRRVNIDASLADFSYQSGECFLYTDNAVIVEYMGCRTLQPVVISRIDYTHSITLQNVVATYDGKYHTGSLDKDMPIGKDGIPLSYRIIGGGTDAGEYEIRLEFFTDSINYNIPEPLYATLTVLPLLTEVVWSSEKFVYDGKLKCPSAYFINEYGAQTPLYVSGGGIYAGDNYVVTANSPSDNYILNNSSHSFSIGKATYDMSGVSWNANSFIYDGEEKSVFISNLPQGVSVIGYVGASAKTVGTYSARVSFAYDTANYYEPIFEAYTWSIDYAQYDLSGFSFDGYSFVYDSLAHYPILNGTMPIGIDGIELCYEFSGSVTNVSEGVRIIEIKFTTASENYLAPQSIYVEIYATPQPIFVEWSNLTTMYTGEEQCPIATSEVCEIAVTGGGINTDKYTVVAHSLDSNYEVANSESEFVILKADNEWITPPDCKDIYESQNPSPTGDALFGECEYKFYIDSELNEEAELPLKSGEYYCVVYVNDSENYSSLCAEPVKFTVMAVVPISLECMINTDLVAFQDINEGDFTLLLHLNDGNTRELSLSDVSISYGEWDDLCVGVENLVFSYGELSFNLPIKVQKASFDLSEVVWSELSYMYDGTPKKPSLLNLPDGLTVKEYIGVGAVDVGEYTIGVIFEYDTENYNLPILPEAVMVISPPATLPNGNDGAHVYILFSVFILLFGLMVFVLIKRRKVIVSYFSSRKAGKIQSRVKPFDKIDNIGSVLSVNAERADELISDSLARTLIRKNPITIKTGGTRRGVINLDTISDAYESGSVVDINSLKDKGLADEGVCYIKVLGRGTINKPLKIFANSFSLNAVKMIALTGGEVNKIQSKRLK